MPDLKAQPSIMIVDDTPANLMVLQDLLLEQGYRVVAFPRGKMALQAAAQRPPDLILLDIMMPEMNGFEVCEQLKKNKDLRSIPVLFISALSEVEDKVRAFSAGGVDFITKPFYSEEVLVRISTHLNLQRARAVLEHYNLRLESLVENQLSELLDSKLATILAMSELIEARDFETGGHIERTRSFCQLLSTTLQKDYRFTDQIDESFVEAIYQVSPLHDIGKVGIPDHILLKPGKLTPEEFELMKDHTRFGEKALLKAYGQYPRNSFLSMAISIARSHHERWDGSGYPDGFHAEDIPLSARIMAIADVYDALRSKRPYKDSISHEDSITIIRDDSPGHFDPRIINIFLSIQHEVQELYARLECED